MNMESQGRRVCFGRRCVPQNKCPPTIPSPFSFVRIDGMVGRSARHQVLEDGDRRDPPNREYNDIQAWTTGLTVVHHTDVERTETMKFSPKLHPKWFFLNG